MKIKKIEQTIFIANGTPTATRIRMQTIFVVKDAPTARKNNTLSSNNSDKNQGLKKRRCCIYHGGHPESKFILEDGREILFCKALLEDDAFWSVYFEQCDQIQEGATPNCYPLKDVEYDFVDYIEYVSCPIMAGGRVTKIGNMKNDMEQILEIEKIAKIMFYAKKFGPDFIVNEIGMEFDQHLFGDIFQQFIICIARYDALNEEALHLMILLLHRIFYYKDFSERASHKLKARIQVEQNPRLEHILKEALFFHFGGSVVTVDTLKTRFRQAHSS